MASYFCEDDYASNINEPPDEDKYSTTEVVENYISAEVTLPRGDSMDQCRVIRHKIDTEGNPIGRANQKYILY